uniref:Uncharacterized protein n=1 Tax=Lepeophtheirus salmonis TaxID=72036 RepID=A0A0K2SW96_LEPSM
MSLTIYLSNRSKRIFLLDQTFPLDRSRPNFSFAPIQTEFFYEIGPDLYIFCWT